MEKTVYTRENIDTFVLVSSDSDMLKVDIVNNDIPLVIDYLFKEEILIESPIPGSKFTKVLINPDWFALQVPFNQ